MNNYILGLLATDGSLREYKWKSKNITTYSIVLEMKDQDIIEKVANYLDTDVYSRTRIINNKQHIFYKTTIGSKKSKEYAEAIINMFNYYNNLSPTEQNKLFTGSFDGDGGICIQKSKSGNMNNYRCYICANSKDHLDKIYEKWFNDNNISYSKYYDKRGSGAFNYNIGKQTDIHKMGKIMYKDKIFLDRKHKIFKENGFLD